MLYASLLKPDFSAELVSVDTATGAPGPSLHVTGAGTLFLLDGSLWAAEDDVTGYGKCMLERLDPLTLVSQAKIPIGCDIAGVSAVGVPDGVWWVDRSTADANGKGGMLRHVDPATNQVDRSVELPFLNGYLSSAGGTVFYGDLGSTNRYYRLDAGATAFAPIAVPQRVYSVRPGPQGLWIQSGDNGIQPGADLLTGSTASDQRIVFESGSLVAADETAVYVDKIVGAGTTLWRYPLDGSAPSQLLAGTTLTTANGDRGLGYFDNDPLVIANGRLVKLWLVRDWPAAGTASVVGQVASLP